MSIWITRELMFFIFRASRYITGLTDTPESKVWDVRISLELPYSISSVLIYYASKSNIQLKSNDHLNISRASTVHFRASRYILGLKHAPESKVMANWICQGLPCSISNVSIYFAPELDIQVKSTDHLNFSGASVVHFCASRYIMGLTHTPESKVIAVRICRQLPCSTFTVSIYYAQELDKRVKCIHHLNFSIAFVVHFVCLDI